MAAGLGFKTFTTGEVLTAGDVNGYLMQGINVFASEAARNAAITSPQEGQFAFTKDNNSLWYYTGSAWVASGATGDIEGVTAGVGISGGGTSGTVTVTNSMATAIDAKGDLVPGTGADTFARLAVGANNTVLTADSSTATGLKWAAAAGGGKVLQVVTGTTTTEVSTSSATYADTGLTATITPSATSSKILVLWTHNGGFRTATANIAADIKLFRGATEIQYSKDNAFTGDAQSLGFTVASSIVDSPSTTSATTYKTQFATANAGSQVILQRGSSGPSTIILMEIGA
jgi:hypothetical protein